MLERFYEHAFDVELYCQMADLIFRLSEHKHKEHIYNMIGNSALFLRKPEQEMEEEYGLRYPGEVLERLDEKETVTDRQLRALGLALAETKELLNDGMFIGKQKPSFWKRMKRTMRQSDLYWLGIQYLTEDGRERELYEKLLDYPVRSVEEVVFILSLLPADNGVWEAVKEKLNLLLSKERNFSVYAYTEIYAWLAAKCHARIEGYRKKDIEALKYLMRLPFSYAKDGSTARNKLLEAGYTVQEIMFLSMSLLYQVQSHKVLKRKGLTAERMAVETCMLFLEGSGEHLDAAGDLCRKILEDYSFFQVRLEDTGGIFDRLYELLNIENVQTYQILFSSDRSRESHSGWFQIDLTDSRWHELYPLMERDDFDRWVCRALSRKPYTKGEMECCLSVYEKLTGEAFSQHFWNETGNELHSIFCRLAEMELICPVDLLEECLAEYQLHKEQACKKWKSMAVHLKRFMKGLQTPEAVEMLFKIEAATGISENELFPAEELLWDSFGLERGYRRERLYFSRLDLIRPFLDTGSHRHLFDIIEQYIFKEYPDMYLSFLVKILSTEDNFLWFPKEEARNIFLKLTETGMKQTELECLQHIYLTEEEQEAVEERNRKRAERHKLMEQMKQVRNIRKDFTRQVAKLKDTEGQFKKLRDYARGGYLDWELRKEKRYITKRYLCSYFEKNPQILLNRKETEELCELAVFLFTEKELTLAEMRGILDHVEIRKEAA